MEPSICLDCFSTISLWGFPAGAMVKNLLASAVDAGVMGSIPGSGRSPGEGNGNPLQYSWLENPRDRGVWRAIVHGISTNQTRLSAYAHPHTISLSSRSTLLLHNKNFYNFSFIFGITTLNKVRHKSSLPLSSCDEFLSPPEYSLSTS